MLYRVLRSYKTTVITLVILALGAMSATFIENDFGSATARMLVYNNIWYECMLGIATINLAFVLYRKRVHAPTLLFHTAFIVIIFGALITRYCGIEGVINIREGESHSYFHTQNPYLHVTLPSGESHFFPLEINALYNPFYQKIALKGGFLEIRLDDFLFHKNALNTSGYFDLIFSFHSIWQKHRFTFGMTQALQNATIHLGELTLKIAYGARAIALPFAIHLKDFTLIRYPGTHSPSEYISDVQLIDDTGTFEATISMNNPLSYKGYKIFQNSYDADENGTILMLNKDAGKVITYIGYALLFIGLIAHLFDPSSRFRVLLGKIPKSILIMLIVPLSYSAQAHAQSDRFAYYPKDSATLAREFGKLIVQSRGRMIPLNTLNLEILYKLSGADSYKGMNADMVILEMISAPRLWEQTPLILIKHSAIRNDIGIRPWQKFARFIDFFDTHGAYKLQKAVEYASSMPPSKRNSYENELLKVDERLNIAFMVFHGELFRLFPLLGDSNNRWLTLRESATLLPLHEANTLHKAITSLLDSAASRSEYEMGFQALQVIAHYQKQSPIYPKSRAILAELLYNKLGIFTHLFPIYLIFGFLVLCIAFSALFAPIKTQRLTPWLYIFTLVLFIIHTFGLALRAYVSGHAPMSDTYETMLYISYSSMLGSMLFFRSSLFTLAGSILMAGIFLFSAHLSSIDPQITTLVPVLKSFWLVLHVSIITASYGFFALGAILGGISLILFIVQRHTRTPPQAEITKLTIINEVSLIIGLTLLVIGNFLGGIWANESWGRYWGWDPKETWSYISIIIYTLIIHMRLFKIRRYEYFFSLFSMWGFSAILMTYFGVNFYLAGLHSYAQGDPIPIPIWVYLLAIFLAFISVYGYKNHQKGAGQAG